MSTAAAIFVVLFVGRWHEGSRARHTDADTDNTATKAHNHTGTDTNADTNTGTDTNRHTDNHTQAGTHTLAPTHSHTQALKSTCSARAHAVLCRVQAAPLEAATIGR